MKFVKKLCSKNCKIFRKFTWLFWAFKSQFYFGNFKQLFFYKNQVIFFLKKVSKLLQFVRNFSNKF